MSKQEIQVNWLEKFAFESEINGHKIVVDAAESIGGQNRGPRPKPLMLLALAGCTGIDMVSILEKMRVKYDDLKIKVSSELSEEHPKEYQKMHITYEFWGRDLPLEKLEKAVHLSNDHYCGVGSVYKKVMPVTFEIIIHDTEE